MCTKALDCEKVCGAWGTAISLVSLEQCWPIELCAVCQRSVSTKPIMAATGHTGSWVLEMWPFDRGIDFLLSVHFNWFKFKESHVTRGHHSVSTTTKHKVSLSDWGEEMKLERWVGVRLLEACFSVQVIMNLSFRDVLFKLCSTETSGSVVIQSCCQGWW